MTAERRRGLWVTVVLVVIAVLLIGWILARRRAHHRSLIEMDAKAKQGLTVTSTDFESGKTIPAKFTCDGANVSPELLIDGTPAEAKSVAVIVDDPDAPFGPFTHWILFNLPPQVHELPEGASPQGAVAGKNDFDKNGYGGPCPPGSKPHHYIFHVYALDSALPLHADARTEDVKRAIAPHLLASGVLVGVYGRGQ